MSRFYRGRSSLDGTGWAAMVVASAVYAAFVFFGWLFGD